RALHRTENRRGVFDRLPDGLAFGAAAGRMAIEHLRADQLQLGRLGDSFDLAGSDVSHRPAADPIAGSDARAASRNLPVLPVAKYDGRHSIRVSLNPVDLT